MIAIRREMINAINKDKIYSYVIIADVDGNRVEVRSPMDNGELDERATARADCMAKLDSIEAI